MLNVKKNGLVQLHPKKTLCLVLLVSFFRKNLWIWVELGRLELLAEVFQLDVHVQCIY